MAMTRKQIYDINKDRLTKWLRHQTDKHATTICAIGVGHDHNTGELVVCMPDDDRISDQQILRLMKGACALLEQQISQKQ